MTIIDHEYTINITCPFCGTEDYDSWEVEGDEDLGLIFCDCCEKEYYATRHITIEYSTEKARYGTCKKCYKDDIVIENYHWGGVDYDDLCVECGEKEKILQGRI